MKCEKCTNDAISGFNIIDAHRLAEIIDELQERIEKLESNKPINLDQPLSPKASPGDNICKHDFGAWAAEDFETGLIYCQPYRRCKICGYPEPTSDYTES